MSAKTFLSKVLYDEDKNLNMILPDELLKALNLKHNEILVWDVSDDKTIQIKRRNIIDTKTI